MAPAGRSRFLGALVFAVALAAATPASAGLFDFLFGDGSRYEDLENAFVYRERTVDNCTCNGRTPYGLATLDARNDPTLRPGDLIATNEGLVLATTAQAAVGQANSDDVTSSLGLRGQLD